MSFWLLCCSNVSGDCHSNCRQSRNVRGNGSPQTTRSEGSVVLGLQRRAVFSLRHCQISGVLGSLSACLAQRALGNFLGTWSRGSLHTEGQTYPVYLMCFISTGAKNVLQCHINTCTHICTKQSPSCAHSTNTDGRCLEGDWAGGGYSQSGGGYSQSGGEICVNPCFIFLVRMLASGLPAAVNKCCPSSGRFQVVKGHRRPHGHEPTVSSSAEVLRRCSWVTSKGLPALLPGE